MKVKIHLTSFLIAFGFLVSQAVAQPYVKHVIVLNEGHYDYANQVQTVPVTIGSYDPSTHNYTPFDTILNARFASCVVVDTNYIYAAADSFLIKYDRYTLARVNTQVVQGIRKIAVWNNQLLITRGQYLINYNSYFQAYDKNSLAFIYELDSMTGPCYSSEGIVVQNGLAYLAVNNGFNYGSEVGIIGKVNLTPQAYLGNVDLGANGLNPFSIATDGSNVYTVNNEQYQTASVSTLSLGTGNLTNVALNTSSGCGASTLVTNYIYYQVSGATSMQRFDVTNLTNYDTLSINQNIYGMVHDPINSFIYAGVTDYTTTGKVFIYNLSGVVQDSFAVSVSPGNMALDIRGASGIKTINNPIGLYVYPNPAHNTVFVSLEGINGNENINVVITDVLGNTVKNIKANASSLKTISIDDLSAGVYSIKVITDKGISSTKIVKQ